MWGPARDNLWAGTSNGTIFHYDGMTWSEVGHMGGVSCDVTLPIQGIWGSGDDIYFYTYAEIAHWNGKKLESLTNWTVGDAEQLHHGALGHVPERHLHRHDRQRALQVDACGAAFIVYYDGKSFHRM